MQHIMQEALRDSAVIERKEGEDDDPATLVTKALADLQKNVDDRLKAVETKHADDGKLKDRLDKIEAKVNRPGGDPPADPDKAAERKAFINYLRHGAETPETDKKILIVADDTRGGYMAPPEVSGEILRAIVQISPIRQFASVRQTTAPSVKYPVGGELDGAWWEGEITPAKEANLTMGETEIVAKRLACFVDISNSLLLGSDGAAETEVREAISRKFAKTEGEAFVNGNGVKQPEGLMTNPNIPVVLNGSTTAISTDQLIALMYDLPVEYRRNGSWLLNGTTVANIRKLKDGQGNYIWQPSFTQGQPETLLGRPIVEAKDMPDAAANAFPILFGDLATTYRIVDRMQLSILSDPYTQALRAVTRLHANRWVGGAVLVPAASRKLKMATS